MKYQKEFEKFMNDYPHLKGGNDLGIQEYSYGIQLSEPEYSSSYIRFIYGEFEKFMDNIFNALKR